ncbi:hypothetical protein [Streptomyces boninensis]|uniref:hypothetical protein n=1 Tax=Streptomyces boninensis TaxID=2039455 RepID=UPI003B222BC7
MPAKPPQPVLPELSPNEALLDFLRAQAVPPDGPGDHALGKWQLHTHPDLCDRLADLAPRHPLHTAYGVPVLAHEGIAAAVALGTDRLLVRLPKLPHNIAAGAPMPPLTDQGWQSVDPWLSELPSAEGVRRLCGLIGGALAHARSFIA